MSVPARQAIPLLEQRAAQAEELALSYQALGAEVEARRAAIQTEEATARKDLARVYIPDQSPETLARAERLTGFRGFSRRDPAKAMAQELAMLSRTVVRIAAEERYTRREWLVGSAGEYTLKLTEARSMLEPWALECQKFESQERFQVLVDVGYDTPACTVPWYHPGYWINWSAGDRICKALGMNDFGDDVLPAWRKVAGERDRWHAEVLSWAARITEVHALVQEHDDAVARIPRLPEIYLDQCQQALAEHLGAADLALLESWLAAEGGEDRGITMGLRRVAGLRAKLDVLGELGAQGLAAVQQDLMEKVRKFRRKADQVRRKGYLRDDSILDPAFDEKMRKLADGRVGVASTVDKVVAYDRYGRFALSNEPEMWYQEFTGRAPGRFSPRLRGWYDQHPQRSLDHDGTGRLLATAAVVGVAASAFSDGNDTGYVS